MSVSFTFDGRSGRIDDGDFVLWGGMAFHLSSAGKQLRAAIDAARGNVHPTFAPILEQIKPRPVFVEVPLVEVEQAVLAMQAACNVIDKDRDASLGSSLLVRQIHACIEGLSVCAAKQ